MTEQLVVIGAGGFGRELLDVVDAINSQASQPIWAVLGVVDDAPSQSNVERLNRRGTDYLGDTDQPLTWPNPVAYVVGIGNPQIRRTMAEKYEARHFRAATLIHPSVTRGSEIEIGGGSVLLAGVRLTTNIRLGRHVHLNPNVTIGHDTTLGDYVSMNPASAVSGECTIEEQVLVGVGAVVLNQLTVHRDAVVGGGACVVRDVPPGVVVKGVPAR